MQYNSSAAAAVAVSDNDYAYGESEQNQLQTAMAYYQQHMLSIKSRNTLAHILAEHTLINETNESYREAIANSPYFDSLALFRLIDHNEKGYICEKDLQNVIGTKHRKLLTYAFTWIDSLKSGEVSRLEFATFLLPRENLQLRELIAQRLQHPQIDSCSRQAVFEQFSIFRQMVLEIIKREMKIIELRRQLLSQPDYSVHGSLLAIDNNRHDWVCAEDLEKFMKNFGYHITLKQVQKLVEVMNSSMDGKVSEQQLQWVIEGLQGNDRSYLKKIKRANKSLPPQKPVNIEQKFVQYRSKSKAKVKITNSQQRKYAQLMNHLREVEQQQKKAEQSLQLREKVTINTMRDMLEEQRVQLQIKRKLQQQERQGERMILQAKFKMQQQMQQLLQKTHLIEAESQRLARIDNRATIYSDLRSIQQTSKEPPYIYQKHHTTHQYKHDIGNHYKQRENRLPSFGQSEQAQQLQANPKNNYQQLSGLYSSELVAGNLSNSNRQSQSIKKHIESSDLYLETTRKIKQQIKAEREAEKHIRDKFNHQQLLKKYQQYTPTHHLQQLSTIQRSQIEGSHHRREELSQASKMQLGLSSGRKGSALISKYDSPQQRVARQSVLEKLDQSTTNKA